MQINTSNLKQNYNTDLGGCKSVNYHVPENPPTKALLRSSVLSLGLHLWVPIMLGDSRDAPLRVILYMNIHLLQPVLMKTCATEFRRLGAGDGRGESIRAARRLVGGVSRDPCCAPVKGVRQELLSLPVKSILDPTTPTR